MRTLLLPAAILTGILCACSQDAQESESLIGHWQAVAATEEGRTLEVDPEEIQFWFYPDETYAFQSTLNYREAGKYDLREPYLITTDTLSPDAPEKAVEIIQLTSDSLTFHMMESDQKRTLVLIKVEDQ